MVLLKYSYRPIIAKLTASSRSNKFLRDEPYAATVDRRAKCAAKRSSAVFEGQKGEGASSRRREDEILYLYHRVILVLPSDLYEGPTDHYS